MGTEAYHDTVTLARPLGGRLPGVPSESGGLATRLPRRLTTAAPLAAELRKFRERLSTRATILCALALLTAACRDSIPVLDPAMTSCIPASAVLVAGLNLAAIRSAPIYPKLPPAVLALTEPLRQAEYAIFVFDGRDLLAITRGLFREPPAGATLLAPNLALAGTPDLVRAAASQHRTGKTGAPELMEPAKLAAGARPIWIVIRGGVTLPLGGNAANINRLLHATSQTTIAIGLRDSLDLELTARCLTAGDAREFEQSLRAILTLTAAANARQPGFAALLRAIQISREDRTVHVTLTAAPDGLDQLLRAF